MQNSNGSNNAAGFALLKVARKASKEGDHEDAAGKYEAAAQFFRQVGDEKEAEKAENHAEREKKSMESCCTIL